MNAPQFTPGPWIVAPKLRTLVTKPEGRSIASAQRRTGGYSKADAEAHANARLIAAAPDLYEALEVIGAMVGGFAGQPNHFGDVYKIADAALAKARGDA